MGIQVSVNIADIPNKWEVLVEEKLVPHYLCNSDDCEVCYGEGCLTEVVILKVKFPKAGWITSHTSDYLLFDNNRVNDEFVKELIENNVPYFRS